MKTQIYPPFLSAGIHIPGYNLLYPVTANIYIPAELIFRVSPKEP